MRQQTRRHVFAYLLMALLAAALVGCSESPPRESSPTQLDFGTRAGGRQGGQPRGGRGQSSPEHLTQLGITGKPNMGQPQGLLVTGFVSSSETAPLAVIGVKEGDVIVSCNDQQQQLGIRLVEAIKGLQESGKPVTLVVMRDGERVTLERTEKLPGSQTDQTPE